MSVQGKSRKIEDRKSEAGFDGAVLSVERTHELKEIRDITSCFTLVETEYEKNGGEVVLERGEAKIEGSKGGKSSSELYAKLREEKGKRGPQVRGGVKTK